MIELKNITKVFNNNTVAVDNCSLHVNEGEIFGIIGHSGAGKSTLLRIINQLEKQDSGEVIINGLDISKLSKKELRQTRTKLGMIFQHFNLLWSRTVSKNIELPLEIANVDKATREARVKQLINLVGLQGKENAYPSELSGGQKQRIGIARALANSPTILLLDEATSALDPSTTESILDLLVEINQKLNITIVLITHQMEVIQKICHHVAVMEDGKIVEQGLLKDILLNPKHPVTKKFFQERTNSIDLKELKKIYQNGILLKLVFDENNTNQPVFSDIIKATNLSINIIQANLVTTPLGLFGDMYVQVIDNNNIKDIVELFNNYNIKAEVI